jgi:hypothetical protein
LLPIAENVSQISPPVRVLLVLSVMFMAAWMTILKPKEETVPPATTPATATAPQSQPGQQVSAAKDAVAGADARNGQAEAAADGVTGATPAAPAATGTTATAPTTSTPAAKAPAKGEAVKAGEAGGLPMRVLQGIADRKVIVLLFWNKGAADDRAVKRELTHIRKDKRKVVVQSAPLTKVSAYQQITRGANVDQSPTVVVVDRNRQVQTLVGFSDRATIDQAVSDALRAK